MIPKELFDEWQNQMADGTAREYAVNMSIREPLAVAGTHAVAQFQKDQLKEHRLAEEFEFLPVGYAVTPCIEMASYTFWVREKAI